ncbi:MAG TPA: 50S ribosomal protein L3 [Phycisphaerales bacterium]|nr:50S ribosomal protein L3 [Phycisphaerales bacterium]HCD32407.1 50S ribosomal protein L3 [Phycisphaerales bacterium]|tara:strand:- start:532 stop:1236 length:705 start_codon:yes stop_codon:yes gene_type:complete
MPKALIGKKIGMTRLFGEKDRYVGAGDKVNMLVNDPVTVLEVGPCFVSQIKTEEVDGYNALQLAFGDIKGRNSTMQLIGHDAKAGVTPKRVHREVRVSSDELGEAELGKALNVEIFEGVAYVDVIATSKGKGTAGPMKRWGFKGQQATHGVERKHRSPGSVGGRSSNLGTGKPKKGGKKAGQMGNKQITVRSLEVVGIDKEKNLLLVKGSVPGANQGMVYVREAIRLFKRKVAK